MAKKAKAYLTKILKSAKVIELRSMKRGHYFRILADIYADNKSVAKLMLNSKLAVPYGKGNKYRKWCN